MGMVYGSSLEPMLTWQMKVSSTPAFSLAISSTPIYHQDKRRIGYFP